jgi:putative addiction module component (TIGR02574 family)
MARIFGYNGLTTRIEVENMGQTTLEELRQLSIAERIQLVEDLWDSIAADSASAPLTAAQKTELDRRLATPDGQLYSWAEIKAGLTGDK